MNFFACDFRDHCFSRENYFHCRPSTCSLFHLDFFPVGDIERVQAGHWHSFHSFPLHSMRLSTRRRPHICLPCQIRTGRLSSRPEHLRPAQHLRRFVSTEPQPSPSINSTEAFENSSRTANSRKAEFNNPFFDGVGTAQEHKCSSENTSRGYQSQRASKLAIRKTFAKGDDTGNLRTRHHATTPPARPIELTRAQQEELNTVHKLRQKLSQGLRRLPDVQKGSNTNEGIRIDEVLRSVQTDGDSSTQRMVERIGTEFSGKSFESVRDTLDLAAPHRKPERRTVTSPVVKAAMTQLGVIEPSLEFTISKTQYQPPVGPGLNNASVGRRRRHVPLAPMVLPPPSVRKSMKLTNPMASMKKTATKTIEVQDLILESVNKDTVGHLPQLSNDLSRVLFNPGVYQLQDPRSRVYNFDPDLAKIMPVSEFNFNALNPYLTSSEDEQLLKLAQDKEKRYVGSSSSMTSALSQFHFLISQWRELTIDNFTRGFREASRTFTIISRSPAAIFLRYRNGVYAVDADKEYDEPNVLMSLGKSMEKLLTLEKSEFEKWRRTNNQVPEEQAEAFHYSTQGRFLLRSQLDAYDPNLPGPGYFDLKTRAVAGVRMNMRDHEVGMGYQIKERYGTWESYEREYYDMMRSTFLKYSLQVRMGFMDGIFVAYHNISRMFGFQYIPISEMDAALHGQTDTCLGDQEFRYSINFLEEIFNIGTQEFPGQSLRLHFDTREGVQETPQPHMHIFIEPMSEENIKAIQETQKAQQEFFEQKLLHGEDPGSIKDMEEESGGAIETGRADKTAEEEQAKHALPPNTLLAGATGPATSDANKEFLDNVLGTKAAYVKPKLEKTTVMGFRLSIQNKVNNLPVTRPDNISPTDKWTMDYQLERMSDDVARKMYQTTKSKRSSAVRAVMNRSSNDYFTRSIRILSEKGAEWRKKQDAIDAGREPVVLYSDRRSG